jgi:hypothetical protein
LRGRLKIIQDDGPIDTRRSLSAMIGKLTVVFWVSDHLGVARAPIANPCAERTFARQPLEVLQYGVVKGAIAAMARETA